MLPRVCLDWVNGGDLKLERWVLAGSGPRMVKYQVGRIQAQPLPICEVPSVARETRLLLT